jgi:hypothetical protein
MAHESDFTLTKVSVQGVESHCSIFPVLGTGETDRWGIHERLMFMFSKKATKIEKIFTVDLTLRYLVNVKFTVKIRTIFVAFLENMNFMSQCPWCPILEKRWNHPQNDITSGTLTLTLCNKEKKKGEEY